MFSENIFSSIFKNQKLFFYFFDSVFKKTINQMLFQEALDFFNVLFKKNAFLS